MVGGLTIDEAIPRFETLEAQIIAVGRRLDQVAGDHARIIPTPEDQTNPFQQTMNMDEINTMKAQLEVVSNQIQILLSEPNSKNRRWDWRKLSVEKYGGLKAKWRSFAFPL